MTKWIIILGGVLVLQIVVAVGVNVGRQTYRAFEPEENLLSFDPAAVDHIRIDGDTDQHVVLDKSDTQWQLPGLNQFPADQGNVKRLLERLAALKKGWPVATTAGAAKRFKVAEASFERKLTLSKGEEPRATLYVGTSPGFRKVHARLPNENAIYAVTFNTFEVGVKPEDWVDKAILTYPVEDIARVELPDFTLQRQDDKLTVVGLAADQETVNEEAQRLLERVAGLNIRLVMPSDGKADSPPGDTVLRYTLGLKSGETQTYVFSKVENDKGHYMLKTSQRDEFFKVDIWTVDQIKAVTRAQLVRKKADDANAAPETPKPNGGDAAGTGG